jgi:tRNA dimethylallyltransferase
MSAPPADGLRHAALVGPTASGKSALALAFARRHRDVELVSIDSMQVYRGMDIGTAKPTPEERTEVPHHLLDLVDPSEEYTVARFKAAFAHAVATIERRGHGALLVGGTGLYLRAVVDALDLPGQYPDVRATLEADQDTEALHARLSTLDPVAASRMEPTNRRRVLRALEVTLGSGHPFSSYGPGLESYPPAPLRLVGLRVDRDELDGRIEVRYRAQVDAGFVDEVRDLLDRPGGLSRTASQALGYKEIAEHVRGRCSLDEALTTAIARTRRFARRQERWFRRDPRIVWIEAGAGHNAWAALQAVLED